MNENQMSLDDFLEEENKETSTLDDFLEEGIEKETKVEKTEVKEQSASSKKEHNPSKKKKESVQDEIVEISEEEIKKTIDGLIRESFNEELRKIAVTVDNKALDVFVNVCNERAVPKIIKEVKEQLQLTRHVVEIPEMPIYESEHPLHECFDDVLAMLLAGFNVYMYGDAGTGKTQIAEDIASALNLPFYNLTSGDMVGVYGYTDLAGTFHGTPFTNSFTNGGVLYISEFDSIDASIALTLNTAIANGITTINDQTVRKHKDFYVLCDGNTRGNGANFEYSARAQLDGSTINRFLYQEVKYDRNIEMFLANKNEDLVKFIDAFREVCQTNQNGCLVTYRAIQAITRLEEKFGIEKSLKVSLLKGMHIDDLKAVQRGMSGKSIGTNRYKEALANIESA